MFSLSTLRIIVAKKRCFNRRRMESSDVAGKIHSSTSALYDKDAGSAGTHCCLFLFILKLNKCFFNSRLNSCCIRSFPMRFTSFNAILKLVIFRRVLCLIFLSFCQNLVIGHLWLLAPKCLTIIQTHHIMSASKTTRAVWFIQFWNVFNALLLDWVNEIIVSDFRI